MTECRICSVVQGGVDVLWITRIIEVHAAYNVTMYLHCLKGQLIFIRLRLSGLCTLRCWNHIAKASKPGLWKSIFSFLRPAVGLVVQPVCQLNQINI